MNRFLASLKEKKFGLPVWAWSLIIALAIFLLWHYYKSKQSATDTATQPDTSAADTSATDSGYYSPSGFGSGDTPWWTQPNTLPDTTTTIPPITLEYPPTSDSGSGSDSANPAPSPTPTSTATHTTKKSSPTKSNYKSTKSATKKAIVPFHAQYLDASAQHGGSIGKTFTEPGGTKVQQVKPTVVGGGGKVVKTGIV